MDRRCEKESGPETVAAVAEPRRNRTMNTITPVEGSVAELPPQYNISENDIARFWRKVNKNGPVPAHVPHLGPCWPWAHVSVSHPYGTFKVRSVNVKPHRMSWLVHFGSIPAGHGVLHKCDNTACVNPEHLFTGTQETNIRDMFAKKRVVRPKGEAHAESKLTDDSVRMIRSSELSYAKLAKLLNVSKSAIAFVKRGERWTHISES